MSQMKQQVDADLDALDELGILEGTRPAVAPVPSDPFAAIASLARLESQRESLTHQLKELQRRIDQHQGALLPQMQKMGIQSFNCRGRTIYVERRLHTRTKGGHEKAALEAAKVLKLSFVKEAFNQSSLSAWVREFERDLEESPDGLPPTIEDVQQQLPEIIRDHLSIAEVHKIRTRKS